MTDIILSIKPKYVHLIVEKLKNHEFRKKIPKEEFSEMIIYSSSPSKEIRYIAETKRILEYPEQIDTEGFGNNEFNLGKKEGKYAIPIVHLWELREPISLSRLREEFGFVPPRSFCYAPAYPKLEAHLKVAPKKTLF